MLFLVHQPAPQPYINEFWVCCMAICLQAAKSYAQGKKQNGKVAAAKAAREIVAKKDTLQAARRSFKEATSCEVKITANLNATYKKGSAADVISAFFRDLVNAKVKVDDAIGIKIAWKEATGAYAIDAIDVETGKAPTGLFPDDALKTFDESVQGYRETIAKIEESKVDTVIIAALAALQKEVLASPVRRQSGAYYLIGEQKFYSGEAIFLPRSEKQYELTAFRDSSSLFSSGSVWSGATQIDSARARFTPSVASASSSGANISAIYSDGATRDTLQCRVVVASVEFEEAPQQKFGFDENNPQTENDYPSFNTIPIHGLKWKSLSANGVPDNVIVKVLPDGAEKAVKFAFSDQENFRTISFTPTSNSRHMLSIATTMAAETNLVVQVGHFTSDAMQLKVRGHNVQGAKKLALVTVHSLAQRSTELTSIMTKNELENYLNNIVYSQIGIKWQIDILPSYTTNYDANGDGKIDVESWPNEEVNLIVGEYEAITHYDYFLFLVDNPTDGSLGWMPSSRFGFIHPDSHRGLNRKHQLQNTIAHELGHGAFSLQHPFHQFSSYGSGGKDRDNFMDYFNGDKVRAYQWQIIN